MLDIIPASAESTDDLLFQLEQAKLAAEDTGFTSVHRNFMTRVQSHLQRLQAAVDLARDNELAAGEHL